jgi:hypothetical protein
MDLFPTKTVDPKGRGKYFISSLTGIMFPATFGEIKLLNKGDTNVIKKFQRLVVLKNRAEAGSSEKTTIFWGGGK